ncbi:MAG: ATP-binding protein [Caldisericia bacterium]
MIISIASGKGGVGKTFVSTNLALSIEEENVQFLDCDVEEPNAHIFLKPQIELIEPVNVLVPEVNENKCTYCNKCSEFCAYNAILVSPKKIVIFPELCHSCGGCSLVCTVNAIKEIPFKIGNIYKGKYQNIDLIYGELDVTRPLAVPIIKEVKKRIDKEKIVIVDCPPGASCPVIESVKGSDFVILVTEPTPFGLHDLKIAVDVISGLKIPFGVIINRSDIGNKDLWDFLERKNITLLLEIPFNRRIAEFYSNGIPVISYMPNLKEKFKILFEKIKMMVKK